MTRKRFEKKMMAAGVSRDAARVLARRRPSLFTYDQWFSCLHLGVAFRSFGRYCLRVGAAFSDLLRTAEFACGEVSQNE